MYPSTDVSAPPVSEEKRFTLLRPGRAGAVFCHVRGTVATGRQRVGALTAFTLQHGLQAAEALRVKVVLAMLK